VVNDDETNLPYENVNTGRDGYEVPRNIHNFEMSIDRSPDVENFDGFGNAPRVAVNIPADINNGDGNVNGSDNQQRQLNADSNGRPEYSNEKPSPYYTWTRPLVESQPYEQNDEEETLPSVDRHLYSQQDGTHTLYSPTRHQQEVQRPRQPYENVVNETDM
jgi:hypothetical protein